MWNVFVFCFVFFCPGRIIAAELGRPVTTYFFASWRHMILNYINLLFHVEILLREVIRSMGLLFLLARLSCGALHTSFNTPWEPWVFKKLFHLKFFCINLIGIDDILLFLDSNRNLWYYFLYRKKKTRIKGIPGKS